MKKLLTIFLCALLCLQFAGCGGDDKNNSSENKQTENQKNTKDYITLLYSAADSFNPYESQTQVNRQICLLLYEPLVKTNNEFEAVNCVAKSVKISGKSCVVTLKNVFFSDGSALTSNDVVFSFNLAKASNTEYGKKLYEAASATVKDSKTVVFNLNSYDPYFKNVLDFPIIKKGSENITDSDSVKMPPIGCGRYKVSGDKASLEINEKYYGKKGIIKKIRLINAPDTESVSHYVEIGASDMYYSDISDGNILRMSGQKIDINLNNMVYLGVNLKSGELGRRELRQAVSSAINRKAICKDIYYNNALAATGFYNPVFSDTKSVQNIQTEPNSQITIENLKEIGYNNLDKEGFYRKAGGALRFSLIVNEQNRIRVNAAYAIAEQLKDVGIKLTVYELPFDQYLQRLQSGSFDFYLAEVNISENMDMRPLVLEGGSMAFGIKNVTPAVNTQNQAESGDSANAENQTDAVEQSTVSNTWADVVNKFYAGETSVADVATILQTDMPIIPICYRTGILFCNDNIENISNSSKSDIYFSIESYKFKVN